MIINLRTLVCRHLDTLDAYYITYLVDLTQQFVLQIPATFIKYTYLTEVLPRYIFTVCRLCHLFM